MLKKLLIATFIAFSFGSVVASYSTPAAAEVEDYSFDF
jgi:hypothetical protein